LARSLGAVFSSISSSEALELVAKAPTCPDFENLGSSGDVLVEDPLLPQPGPLAGTTAAPMTCQTPSPKRRGGIGREAAMLAPPKSPGGPKNIAATAALSASGLPTGRTSPRTSPRGMAVAAAGGASRLPSAERTAARLLGSRSATSYNKVSPRRPLEILRGLQADVPRLDLAEYQQHTPKKESPGRSSRSGVSGLTRRVTPGHSRQGSTSTKIASQRQLMDGVLVCSLAFDDSTLAVAVAPTLCDGPGHASASSRPVRLQVWPGRCSADELSLIVHGVHQEVVSSLCLCRRDQGSENSAAMLVSCSPDRVVVWSLDELWHIASEAASNAESASVAHAEGVALLTASGHAQPLGIVPDGASRGTCATLYVTDAMFQALTVATRIINVSSSTSEADSTHVGVADALIVAVAHGLQVMLFSVRSDLQVTQTAELSLSEPPRHLLITGSSFSLSRHAEPHDWFGVWVADSCGQLWSCDVNADADASGSAASESPQLTARSLLPGIAVQCLAPSATAPSRCYVGGTKSIIQILDARSTASGGPSCLGATGRLQVADGRVPVSALHAAIPRGNEEEETLVALMADGSVYVQDLVSVAGEPVLSGNVCRALFLGSPSSGSVVIGALGASFRVRRALSGTAGEGPSASGPSVAWVVAGGGAAGSSGVIRTMQVPLLRTAGEPQQPQPSQQQQQGAFPGARSTLGSTTRRTPTTRERLAEARVGGAAGAATPGSGSQGPSAASSRCPSATRSLASSARGWCGSGPTRGPPAASGRMSGEKGGGPPHATSTASGSKARAPEMPGTPTLAQRYAQAPYRTPRTPGSPAGSQRGSPRGSPKGSPKGSPRGSPRDSPLTNQRGSLRGATGCKVSSGPIVVSARFPCPRRLSHGEGIESPSKRGEQAHQPAAPPATRGEGRVAGGAVADPLQLMVVPGHPNSVTRQQSPSAGPYAGGLVAVAATLPVLPDGLSSSGAAGSFPTPTTPVALALPAQQQHSRKSFRGSPPPQATASVSTTVAITSTGPGGRSAPAAPSQQAQPAPLLPQSWRPEAPPLPGPQSSASYVAAASYVSPGGPSCSLACMSQRDSGTTAHLGSCSLPLGIVATALAPTGSCLVEGLENTKMRWLQPTSSVTSLVPQDWAARVTAPATPQGGLLRGVQPLGPDRCYIATASVASVGSVGSVQRHPVGATLSRSGSVAGPLCAVLQRRC
jgi:hypothetical protein